MIQFIYQANREPYFLPLCAQCGRPIEDPYDANLEIDQSCTGGKTEDCRVYHLGCLPTTEWFPWIRLSDALFALLGLNPREWKPRKPNRHA